MHRVASGTGRLIRAWRVLPPERRLAALASLGLFVALFLPWYHETVVAVGRTASTSLTGWQAFSFVEAAVLLVAAGVVTLLFQRAEGRAFHLPGGDGGVITAAGLWTCLLVIWRIFDKQSVHVHGPGTTISGIEWGIFFALVVAAFLAYSGSRIRAAHQPEPPLPGSEEPQRFAPANELHVRARTPRPVRAPEPAPETPRADERTTRVARPRADERTTRVVRRARPVAADEQLTIPLDELDG
jgi:hypothetical protein